MKLSLGRRVALALVPLLATTGLLAVSGQPASAWTPKTPPMTTPWTNSVSTTNPLPEYPRPQLTRPDWQNLNGIWDFAVTGSGQSSPPATFGEQIRVPFPVESALSGIQRRVTEGDKLWYRRTFTIPAGWSGRRVQLNFGAVDWQTTVWVNGTQAGAIHSGGYDAFSYDITSLLNGGTNTIVVGVWDPTDAGSQAVGKQRRNDVLPHPGGGIFYTGSSGIWQTVWLEPTPSALITRVDLVPNLSNNTLAVTVFGAGLSGHTAFVSVLDGTTVVGTASGSTGAAFSVSVPNARRWSPSDPFLYNVRVELRSGSTVVDSVGSYAGMRSISTGVVNGQRRILLNGQFVFQTGTLDQGYWPDGIYTAPTDAALRYDLQAHKDLGFNMVRKHIKVEPQRWFYAADQLGLLVWQDMPAMPTGVVPSAAARTQWELEYDRIIDQHRSSPSVVMWVNQNEGWGQYDQARIANEVKAYDPSRLVNNMSGVNCCGSIDGGNGDVVDNHVYVGPGATRPSSTRAAVLGEFGGLGLRVSGHEWSPGNGFSYEDQGNATRLNDRLNGLYEQLRTGGLPSGLSASVYTEITDVENEVNGLVTYDRQIVKVDAARLRASNQALIAASSNPGSFVSLPSNVYRSFRATTACCTTRYIRHQNSLGYTEVVTASSTTLLKQDATWRIVPGLADSSCYSFESRNYPGRYLRHQAFRVRMDTNDNSALFRADATWCAQSATGGVRLTAWGFPGQYLRHYNAELWLATPGGPSTYDNPSSFLADTTWSVDAAWAP
ncbi:AbfB domain-containing protein [Dactylosporangium sp. AC04546]|uniref:AbfB domain-containing protein n=1 Tax=Dactylosporangium sp. AC04546 TaxID=2862460 RepID=UPI001EDEFFB3|nr:AbfB domain-containing protein [Dactylosporangium sp. AC04546]WVK83508.1 AbfB domain-containing protein [Dactylosporangium sp. AC04546]